MGYTIVRVFEGFHVVEILHIDFYKQVLDKFAIKFK